MNAITKPDPKFLEERGIAWPPTQDELPYDDGEPMESERHVLQMTLLIETLRLHWRERPDGFIGGNMFVYFSLAHIRNQDFRGPDFFAVKGVPRGERKSWVLWEEEKGPDVVIELLSVSTAAVDKGQKKRIYQDLLRVPEYYWYDPFSGELAGFRLHESRYLPIELDSQGCLASKELGLVLVRREGVYLGVVAPWLRWALPDGTLLPTMQEEAEQERHKAEQERHKAEQERHKAEQERDKAEQERRRAEQAERRVAELEALLARARERFDSDP